jgi:hypothetical protein
MKTTRTKRRIQRDYRARHRAEENQRNARRYALVRTLWAIAAALIEVCPPQVLADLIERVGSTPEEKIITIGLCTGQKPKAIEEVLCTTFQSS